jgi:phytoene desaturase
MADIITGTDRVVVVGAGLGGLAAAIRLAVAGRQVTLLEREAVPGGRAGLLTQDGFRFDTGPSVFTMPHLVAELFELAGERMTDHLRIERLDPAYRARFHDGSELAIRGSVEAMRDEVAAVCGVAEADRFVRFADHLRRLYDAEYDHFIDANFDSVLQLARPVAMARLLQLGGFRRLYPLVASHLQDWRMRRMFTFQAMYAGMSPYQALGVYAVIAYMDSVAGVYYPRGGIHRVSQALADLAVRCGVDLRLSTPVSRVDVRDGRVRAVETAHGERIPADVAVLNPDLPIAYRDLLGEEHTPRRVKRLRYSPSCLVVHLGLSAPPKGAAHHNIHFAAGYRESFDDLLAGRMQRDPSWFLTVPTVSDPSVAPPGGATAFYLLPTPNLADDALDWDAQGPRELQMALRRMEDAGYGPVGGDVVTSDVVTPADWRRQGMAAGTPFAASHHFLQTGPFRPRNVAPTVAGVVFAGSSTVPGVGVPMVLISGKLAAERVLEDRAVPRRTVVGGPR